jgi:hypothetical protein
VKTESPKSVESKTTEETSKSRVPTKTFLTKPNKVTKVSLLSLTSLLSLKFKRLFFSSSSFLSLEESNKKESKNNTTTNINGNLTKTSR